jgi:hypothetical protein
MSAVSAPLITAWRRLMDRFVHSENVTRYRKLIAISENDPARDEARHQTLLKLLADELVRDKQPKER